MNAIAINPQPEGELLILQHSFYCRVCGVPTPHALLIGRDWQSRRSFLVCLLCMETTCKVYGDESLPRADVPWPQIDALDYAGQAPVCLCDMPEHPLAQAELFTVGGEA